MPAVEKKSESRLNFPPGGIISFHADIRISLREVRARQRNPRPLQRLEGRGMPALRLEEIVQEVLHLRLGHRRHDHRQFIRQRRRTLLWRWLQLPLNFRRDELCESPSKILGTRVTRPSGFTHSDTAWTWRTYSANAGFPAPLRQPTALPRCRTGFSPVDF